MLTSLFDCNIFLIGTIPKNIVVQNQVGVLEFTLFQLTTHIFAKKIFFISKLLANRYIFANV